MTGAITTTSTFDGRDVATDGSKLDAIEASADVTDTTNVTASGALMDSEVTNLAQVKAFATSDYATSTQGTTADAALPKAGGTMTGTIAGFTSTGIDDNATSTAITIDASENVGIGTSSPSSKLEINIGGDQTQFEINKSRAGDEAMINLEHTTTNRGSFIRYANATDSWKVGMNGAEDFVFETSASLTGNGTEQVRFLDSGGITFNGDTAAANALDDYEEGTWTPATSTSGYTITSTSGYYTKVGNIVSLTGQFTISVVGTNNAVIILTGLPYTSAAITNFHYIGVAREVQTRGQMYVTQVNAGQSIMGMNAMNGVVSGDNKVLVTDKYSFNVTYRV
jgi:hypothetical protein